MVKSENTLSKNHKLIGLLTSGGDCPGLNAVIRAVVLLSRKNGYKVMGFRRGWEGLYKNNDFTELIEDDIDDIDVAGGTIIGTSWFNPTDQKDGLDKIVKNLKKIGCQALISIGGSESLETAEALHRHRMRVIVIPKTIDNDITGTDNAFGFDTAINVAMEALDRLHNHAKSNARVLVIEVMGRETGWMALYAGLAGGAHDILIPEVSFKIGDVCDLVLRRKEQGNEYCVIVVSEGAKPKEQKYVEEFKTIERQAVSPHYTGISFKLANIIAEKTGMETRNIVLGHLQRSGIPTTYDRVLGYRMGIKAVELLIAGKSGRMVALRGGEIKDIPVKEAIGKFKRVPLSYYSQIKNVLG